MNRWAPGIAALVAAAIYLPSLGNGFALDDQGQLAEEVEFFGLELRARPLDCLAGVRVEVLGR